jgi:NADPH:quinone reductase-like Zn-dependent oxidoreductase
MAWQYIGIVRFGGPEVLELAEQPPIPDPGEVRIKVLAAGTGFTDTFIRRGRYRLQGAIAVHPGLRPCRRRRGDRTRRPPVELTGQLVADLCVVGGYAQYAIRPARFLVPAPDGVDPAEAVCIPLAYLTAYQMLTRYRSWRLGHGRNGAARSDTSSRPKGDRHLLGHQRGYGRALRCNGDRLSRSRLRRGCARAHRRAQRRSWRRCSL